MRSGVVVDRLGHSLAVSGLLIDRLTLNNDYFGWKRMSWDQKLTFLLGDGPAPSTNHDVNLQWAKMEICFYHYLAHAYDTRRNHLA